MGALQACAMTDLYIMARSDAPGIVKIGSSQNVERRRRELEKGHTFKMVTLASFPRVGQFELRVHRKLDNVRVLTGTGREWYRISPSEAFQTVIDVVFGAAPNLVVTHPQSKCDMEEEAQASAGEEMQNPSDDDVEAPRKKARGRPFNSDTLEVLNKIYAGGIIDTRSDLKLARAAKTSLDLQVRRLAAAGRSAHAVQAKSDKVKKAILTARVKVEIPEAPAWWEELGWDCRSTTVNSSDGS